MTARASALAMVFAGVLVAACGPTLKPLPGGLPPEYEPSRPFPSAAPASGAQSAAPAPSPASSAAPAKP